MQHAGHLMIKTCMLYAYGLCSYTNKNITCGVIRSYILFVCCLLQLHHHLDWSHSEGEMLPFWGQSLLELKVFQPFHALLHTAKGRTNSSIATSTLQRNELAELKALLARPSQLSLLRRFWDWLSLPAVTVGIDTTAGPPSSSNQSFPCNVINSMFLSWLSLLLHILASPSETDIKVAQ